MITVRGGNFTDFAALALVGGGETCWILLERDELVTEVSNYWKIGLGMIFIMDILTFAILLAMNDEYIYWYYFVAPRYNERLLIQWQPLQERHLKGRGQGPVTWKKS